METLKFPSYRAPRNCKISWVIPGGVPNGRGGLPHKAFGEVWFTTACTPRNSPPVEGGTTAGTPRNSPPVEGGTTAGGGEGATKTKVRFYPLHRFAVPRPHGAELPPGRISFVFGYCPNTKEPHLCFDSYLRHNDIIKCRVMFPVYLKVFCLSVTFRQKT